MNTHAGYSKRTITDTNVLLAGGGDKSLADFLGGIQYVSASHKIQIKTAEASASWTDLVTLVTTDENVKLTPKTDNANRPLMMINGGTSTGTLTSTSMFSTGIYANASTKMITTSGFIKTGSDDTSVLLAGGGAKALSDFAMSDAYLPLAGGTMIGNIGMGGDSTKFLISSGSSGANSPLRGTKMPATSSNWIGLFARPGKSTDEGGILLSEDTCVIYNSHDTGWGFLVVDTDLSQSDWSVASAQAFGVNLSHLAWSLGGFVKSGSSDSYVLLGGGGHKAINDFAMADTYVKKAGDTMTGSLTFSQPSSDRRIGIIGSYDPNRTAAIWSMGSSYQVAADGLSFGNLYGAAYAYFGSGYTFGAGYSNGHSMVWCQGGTVHAALGNSVWSRGGFVKSGSSDSYVLLGGGGHKAVSDFAVTSHTHPFSQITDGTCTSTASGWSHVLNNSYGGSTKAQLYMCHGGGYGMHLRGYSTSASVYMLLIYNSSSEVFGVYGDGHSVFGGNVTATNFYTTSDRNKKTNISSFSEHIRKFQLKDTEKWHYGVIALEVPEMFRDGEEGNMTVNYNSILSFYIGLLENRVKELEDKLKKYEEIQNI